MKNVVFRPTIKTGENMEMEARQQIVFIFNNQQ